MSTTINNIHPKYYDRHFKSLIRHKFSEEQQITIAEFNAYKYLYRWRQKNGVQDLKKAIWYLKEIIKKQEKLDAQKTEKSDEFSLNKQLYEKYSKYVYKPELLN